MGISEKVVFGVELGSSGTPCYVAQILFDMEEHSSEITLDFPPGTQLPTLAQVSPVWLTIRNGASKGLYIVSSFLARLLPLCPGWTPTGKESGRPAAGALGASPLWIHSADGVLDGGAGAVGHDGR